MRRSENCAARIRRQRQSEKIKRFDFDVPYLLLAPRQPWEPYGQACSLQTVHWLPKGLADYNPRSASPSDVWANDNAYHNTPPKVVAKRGTAPSFRSKWIAQSQQHKPPSLKREAAYVRLVVALFPASLAQAGTYPHGWYSLFKLQGERFFFPVRPIAHEKVPRASCFKKFF